MTESNDPSSETKSRSEPAGKVARVLYQYDLEALGEELEERWTREENRMGLRELADHFNKRLLAESLAENETNILEGEMENYYHLLTDDDVSSGTRIQAENKLEQQGVDVDELRSNFVSRQAIHTYLTKQRNVTYEPEVQTSNDRVTARIDTIRRIKSRLGAVSNQILYQLAQSGDISNESPHLTVLVQVTCERCSTQYTITEFISNGGCDCETDIPQ